MRILISAGEASGEFYGAELMQALRQQVSENGPNPAIDFFGVGGQQMRTAGCDLLVDAREIAEVGIIEVIKHIPNIYRRFRQVVREAERRRPDVAVLIDFPDFNLRLARELHQRGVPVIYYVSPQLWAWKQRRIEQVRKYVREMLVIFPFEERFYRERGIAAKFVGHPLADLPAPKVTREEFAAEYKLDPERQWIALLPGSRRGEVSRIFSGLLQATSRPRVRLHSTCRFHSACGLGRIVLARLFGTTDYLHARCSRDAAARTGGCRGQRHIDFGSGADRHSVCHGVPGCAAHLGLGSPSSKSRPLRHGEPYRGTGCGSRAGAGGIHAATSLCRTAPDHSRRRGARNHDRRLS